MKKFRAMKKPAIFLAIYKLKLFINLKFNLVKKNINLFNLANIEII